MPCRTMVTVVLVLVSLAACGGPSSRFIRNLQRFCGTPGVFCMSMPPTPKVSSAPSMGPDAQPWDLILKLYGQARGKAAEYWGEPMLDSDRWVRTMGVYSEPESGTGSKAQHFGDSSMPSLRE